jgi:hypothetical protein
VLGWVLALAGLGALVTGVVAVLVGGLLLGPLLVWLAWTHRSASLHWPPPTLRDFVAVCLLLAGASASAHPHKDWHRQRPRDKTATA